MRLGKDGKVELLKKVPLFSRLNKKSLQDVAHITDELDLPAGKEMATEGNRGREFFVLLNGEAEVHIDGSLVGKMGPGDVFVECCVAPTQGRIEMKKLRRGSDVGNRKGSIRGNLDCRSRRFGHVELAGRGMECVS